MNRAKVGNTIKDKAENGYYLARAKVGSLEVDNEVLIPMEGNYLRIGDFAEVRITGGNEQDLRREVV
jgi:ribosomal protein S12 methylthiotransferase